MSLSAVGEAKSRKGLQEGVGMRSEHCKYNESRLVITLNEPTKRM